MKVLSVSKEGELVQKSKSTEINFTLEFKSPLRKGLPVTYEQGMTYLAGMRRINDIFKA